MKRLLIVLVAACGGSQPAPPTTPATPPPATGAATTGITLCELKFYEGDVARLALHADGKLEANLRDDKPGSTDTWTAVAQLTADGKIAHDGQSIGELRPDGTFVGPNGQTADFKMEGDVLVAADKRVTLDDKGVLQGGNPGSDKLHVEGATDAASRRTALFILAVMISTGSEH